MQGRLALLAAAIAALSGCGGSTAPATPVPTSITVAPTPIAFDAIGATSQLTATVLDQGGRPIASASPTWTSASPSVATVSSSGLVAAAGNGSATITASIGQVRGQASVSVAQVPHVLTKVSGDQQTGTTGQALASPLVVQLNDRLGHGVGGIAVQFAVTGASGSVAPAIDTTMPNGRAQTTWTLGGTAGPQSLRARVAQVDSATFGATAQAAGSSPTITGLAPDTLVEGATATISGTNFSASPANDVVTIDGVAATVTSATSTSLSVTVPTYSCQPLRMVTVGVQIGTQSASSAATPLRPRAMTALGIGQEAIVQDPAQFCLQFAASAGGNDFYVMGLSAPAEVPGAVLPFVITTRGGASPGALVASSATRPMTPTLPVVPNGRAFAAGLASGRVLRGSAPVWRERAGAEGKVRGFEARYVVPRLAVARRQAPRRRLRAAGALVPNVGDTLTIRVPDFNAANPCTSFTSIQAVVRVVGAAGLWVEDVANPTTDSLTLADIQSASNQFDSKIYATDTSYFGAPSDIDGNSRVIVVLSWQVNRDPRILGFVFGGDLLPKGDASCPESNGGELYYGQVPDPANVAGTGARAKSDVVAEMPQLISHEFTHIIQLSRRLVLADGAPMTSWEMEGQATFAEELVGDAVLGNTSGQNYGASVAFGAAGFNWYEDVIVKWADYFGLLGPNDQAANAPDLCTVYGNIQLSTPCDLAAFYGASWSLQRYIGDQYGPGYAGGLQQLTRDWVSKNVTATGTTNIGELLGISYDSLFVRYATAQALDDQANLSGTAWVPAAFSITSWNSADLSSYLQSCCSLGWLTPPSMSFASGSASRSVRGGSTAYTILSAGGAHAAMAVRVTDPSSNPLGTGLRPALWVVRVQ